MMQLMGKWTYREELDELAEERLAGQVSVVGLGHDLGGLDQLHGGELEATALEAAEKERAEKNVSDKMRKPLQHVGCDVTVCATY